MSVLLFAAFLPPVLPFVVDLLDSEEFEESESSFGLFSLMDAFLPPVLPFVDLLELDSSAGPASSNSLTSAA